MLCRACAALCLAATAAWAAPALALPTFDEVRADFRSSETLVLSREGEVIQRVRTDATVRRGQWLGLADMSPALRIEPFDEAAIVRHLAAHGLAPHGPASSNFGAEGDGPSLYLGDPDGNTVELKGPSR